MLCLFVWAYDVDNTNTINILTFPIVNWLVRCPIKTKRGTKKTRMGNRCLQKRKRQSLLWIQRKRRKEKWHHQSKKALLLSRSGKYFGDHIPPYSFLSCLPAESPCESTPNNDVKESETSNVQQVETKIYKEYAAAKDQEGIHKYTNWTKEWVNHLKGYVF